MPAKREQFIQTIRAQYLGEQMRRMREDRGLTLKYIAAHLGVEFSTLARYERAEWPFRRDHVISLLDVYGVYDEVQRSQLIELSQSAWQINQWQPVTSRFDSLLPTNGKSLLPIDPWWLQAKAEELCIYAPLLIPEVVQTRDYAECIVRQTVSDGRRVDQIVARLIGRQQQLDDQPRTRLTILLEEQVLHRSVGGRAVLQQQLEFLTRTVERPHVDIRVLPDRTGWHPGLDGPFTVCMPPRPYPPTALVDHLTGRLVVEATDADRYVNIFTKLKETALEPVRSVELIQEAADDLSGGSRSIGTAGQEAE